MGARGDSFHLRDFKSSRYGQRDREAGLRWHTNPIITKHLEEVRSARSDRAVGRWRLGNCRIGEVGLWHRDCSTEPPLLGLRLWRDSLSETKRQCVWARFAWLGLEECLEVMHILP